MPNNASTHSAKSPYQKPEWWIIQAGELMKIYPWQAARYQRIIDEARLEVERKGKDDTMDWKTKR